MDSCAIRLDLRPVKALSFAIILLLAGCASSGDVEQVRQERAQAKAKMSTELQQEQMLAATMEKKSKAQQAKAEKLAQALGGTQGKVEGKASGERPATRLGATAPSASALSCATTWAGLIGVDYNPNHYSSGNTFNNHDVFYVGAAANPAATNVYAELAQLKAAGFTAVRSYQTVEYAWIDLINSANSLGLSVVYEAVIPQNGSSADTSAAVTLLNNVLAAVGATVFNNTVILVLAGHENYSNTDISYLTSAVSALQTALTAAGASAVPVGSALVSGNLVTPGSPSDMQTLINSYSSCAPLGFDPYPFQWGVTPADQAASGSTLANSIAWDYAQVKQQSFYVSPRPILMAETGWATSGSGQYANYYCYGQNDCQPSVANAAAYLQAVYTFIGTAGNTSGVLVFEAYDEPAKDPAHADDAENHYGLFDSNCTLKNSNTNLLPNTAFVPANNPGCQGFTSGQTFAVVGTQPNNATNQPPFTVAIAQTNPVTNQSGSMTVTVPNRNRTNQNVYPWPQFLAFNNATVTISGTTSGASCSVPATVNGSTITWGTVTCTNQQYLVNCNGLVCYLPWNNF
jgi:hypothetical protein